MIVTNEDLSQFLQLESRLYSSAKTLLDEYRQLWSESLNVRPYQQNEKYEYSMAERRKIEVNGYSYPDQCLRVKDISSDFISYEGTEYFMGDCSYYELQLPTWYLTNNDDWREDAITLFDNALTKWQEKIAAELAESATKEKAQLAKLKEKYPKEV